MHLGEEGGDFKEEEEEATEEDEVREDMDEVVEVVAEVDLPLRTELILVIQQDGMMKVSFQHSHMKLGKEF